LKINLPSDYEIFTQQQKKYIKKELNGKRILRMPRKIFLIDVFSNIKDKIILNKPKIEDHKSRQLYYSGRTKHFPSWNKTNIANIKLLQNLGKLVKSNGDFTIIDSFQFHNTSNPSTQFASKWLKTLSSHSSFGYIPLYEKLNDSRNNGKSPRWKYDEHLNKIGNEIFAESMFNYLEKKLN
jgi:hypothetical protein